VEGLYFLNAGVLFRLAKAAYQNTKSASSDTLADQDDALVAIIFSAATLEAFIMELAHLAAIDAASSTRESPARLLAAVLTEAEESCASVRLKYCVSKALLSRRTYDKGAKPYQDFHLLFRVRDSIVHLKPERIEEEPHKIVKALSSMGLCEREDPHARSSWLAQISTRAVARWACNVVSDMVSSIRDCFPDDAESGRSPFRITELITGHFGNVD
jgi:hypothetical protein